MRPLILVPMLLLPLSACMTQRDQAVWQEFKTEVSSGEKKDAQKAQASEGGAGAASEAVTPPSAVDKTQE